MTDIVSINLDDEAKKIKNSLFSDKENKREFSAWVRRKLIEEAEQTKSIDYIKNKIKTKNLELQKLEIDIAELEKQLSEIFEIKQSNQSIQVEVEARDKPEETKTDKAHKLKFFVRSYFGIKAPEDFSLAEELQSFIEENGIEDITLAFVKFSLNKNIPFVKQFPFLERYGLINNQNKTEQ